MQTTGRVSEPGQIRASAIMVPGGVSVCAYLLGLLEVLEVQLEQGLDVVAGEGDRDQELVVDALLAEPLDGVNRLRAQPGARPDLGLPHQPVRVPVPEPGHHRRHGRADLAGVGVAAVDDRHRE